MSQEPVTTLNQAELDAQLRFALLTPPSSDTALEENRLARIQLLREKGANMSGTNAPKSVTTLNQEQLDTQLLFALLIPPSSDPALEENRVARIRLLITKGANVSATNRSTTNAPIISQENIWPPSPLDENSYRKAIAERSEREQHQIPVEKQDHTNPEPAIILAISRGDLETLKLLMTDSGDKDIDTFVKIPGLCRLEETYGPMGRAKIVIVHGNALGVAIYFHSVTKKQCYLDITRFLLTKALEKSGDYKASLHFFSDHPIFFCMNPMWTHRTERLLLDRNDAIRDMLVAEFGYIPQVMNSQNHPQLSQLWRVNKIKEVFQFHGILTLKQFGLQLPAEIQGVIWDIIVAYCVENSTTEIPENIFHDWNMELYFKERHELRNSLKQLTETKPDRASPQFEQESMELELATVLFEKIKSFSTNNPQFLLISGFLQEYKETIAKLPKESRFKAVLNRFAQFNPLFRSWEDLPQITTLEPTSSPAPGERPGGPTSSFSGDNSTAPPRTRTGAPRGFFWRLKTPQPIQASVSSNTSTTTTTTTTTTSTTSASSSSSRSARPGGREA